MDFFLLPILVLILVNGCETSKPDAPSALLTPIILHGHQRSTFKSYNCDHPSDVTMTDFSGVWHTRK